MAKWLLRRNSANIELMSGALNISPIFSYILANRGLRTKKDALAYLKPDISCMHDPFLMKDLKKAIDIILKSISSKERMVIYGDYDADGVMSTVILYKTLKLIGADVDYYIPHREKEGYGLNNDTAMKLIDAAYDVVITCDNGISALDEVALLKKYGVKVIIIDHHEPGFVEDENGNKTDVCPCADAVIDPKQQACGYPFTHMCAGGLAFKFAAAVFTYLKRTFTLCDELIVLAAIATICDIVDLTGENRVIVKRGLELINSTRNIGLKALITEKQLQYKNITPYHVGFIIGPCINATGRLDSAAIAVKLFLSDDPDEAFGLAGRLSVINDERKNMTTQAVSAVSKQIEAIKDNKVLVVYNETIHESIAGIVAGKIKETYFKPTIVITKSESACKGSGRSIEGYNMFEALFSCRSLLERFGGHYMAAGLSIKEENIERLSAELNRCCTLTDDDFMKTVRIEKELMLSEVTKELAFELSRMEPFGKENREAVFGTKNVFVESVNFVGANKNIMQFTFIDENDRKLRGVCFDGFENFKSEALKNFRMDIVYSVEINEYNGNKYLQLNIKDFR